jgi:hypothetical protein
MRLEKNV